MEDIRFYNLVKIVDFFSNDRVMVLSGGSEGFCYRIGNKTYKLYNELYCNLLNNDISIRRLLKFRDLIVENVYFIRALIYFNDDIMGSVCDYAKGTCCAKAKLHRRKLDRLISALSVLKKNVFELSELGIYINDSFLGNILYDGNNFKLIDTGSYFYSSEILSVLDEDKDDVLVIYRKNMTKIMEKLFINITDKRNDMDNFIFSFLWYIDSPYKNYLIDSDLMINPDETIIGIRDTIQEYIGYEIDTFSRCRTDLLKIRKR